MKKISLRRTFSIALALCVLAAPYGRASDHAGLDRDGIVAAIGASLEDRYVFPGVASQMADRLRDRLDAGDYDGIASTNAFAYQLTVDLRAVSNDGHIVVYEFDAGSSASTLADDLSKQDVAQHARDNFCFKKAERLAGNVGYLKFDCFDYAEIGGPTATAAMSFVANSDALIIDLRDNRGGKKDMVQYLASYFFREPTHFLTVYDRDGRVLDRTESLAYVPGARMLDTPVFILTSPRTGSAAEAFAYNLQSFDRATVVGETTRGIAHWVEPVDFPEHGLRIHLPYARPENARTHTNWEGVGVRPDVEAPADEALAVAHLDAMADLIAACPDDEHRRLLEWELVDAQAQAEPVTWDPQSMASYTGVYGDGKYSIEVKDGSLVWNFSADEEHILLPLTADTLVLADDNNIRVRFSRDESGAVSDFQLVYSDGYQGREWPRTADLR